MIYDHPDEEFLDMMTIYIGKPEFGDSTIRVPVRDLIVRAGFPNHPETIRYKSCILIYEDVVFSLRRVSEYIDETGKGFKSNYYLLDGPFSINEDMRFADFFHFTILCVSDDLNAWVGWDILARHIRVEPA